MRSVQNLTLGAVVLLSLMTEVRPAEARRSNFNVMAGPVFAWTYGERVDEHDGWVVGWEGGVGDTLGVSVRLNVGQMFRPGGIFTYAVVEPWLLVGGTFGVGFDRHATSVVLGVWEGIGLQDAGRLENGTVKGCHDDGRPEEVVAAVSLAAGYRWGGGRTEIYLTPKAGFIRAFCIP